MSKLNEMRSHVVAKQGVKEMQSWLDHSILSAYLRRQNCNDEIIRCLQSPSVIQKIFAFWTGDSFTGDSFTPFRNSVRLFLSCRWARLTASRPFSNHVAIQADEVMLTLASGSIFLSRSARGVIIQTFWIVSRHSDPFSFINTVLLCVPVTPLSMFLLEYLFETYLLIFAGHASWSQSFGICRVVILRYYWVCRSKNLQRFHLLTLRVWKMFC